MANGNPEPEDKRLIQKDPSKKPYLKPSFRFDRVFVTSALTCGKADATQTLCRLTRKVS
jgi:hypothetical protein